LEKIGLENPHAGDEGIKGSKSPRGPFLPRENPVIFAHPTGFSYMILWDSPRTPAVVSHHGEWREGTMVMYGDHNWGYLHHARGIRNVKRPHSKVLRDGCSITPGW